MVTFLKTLFRCRRRSLVAGLLCLLPALLVAEPSLLKVVGNRLVDDTGNPVRLRGVNCAGLEWAADGDGHIARTLEVAIVDWHTNLIRLPLAQDRWFGRAPEQKDDGAAYRALVRQLVDFCSAHNAYIMLDLHWSDASQWGQHIGQHRLPDRNSVEFWKSAAAAFKDEPAVLFDLYNEPHSVTWGEWFQGGPITETDKKTNETWSYEAVGLPELFAAVRSTGATNVVVASGINWAFEVDGILAGHQIVETTGRGVVYAVHPYPHKFEHVGLETIDEWIARLEPFAQKLPLIVTEFGSIEKWWPFPPEWNCNDEKWNREVLRQLEDRGWNWVAWDFHPAAAPCLISGWDYAPTPEFGVWVKQALAANGK